jgi:threonine/homoserine efflux transporter RhtA
MREQQERPTPEEREAAREYVVQRLGLVSMVIWIVLVMAFMWFVFPSRTFRPTVGMMLGTMALGLAAAPWVVYPYLVERVARRRAAARTHG